MKLGGVKVLANEQLQLFAQGSAERVLAYSRSVGRETTGCEDLLVRQLKDTATSAQGATAVQEEKNIGFAVLQQCLMSVPLDDWRAAATVAEDRT
jgi:hypothetical protein